MLGLEIFYTSNNEMAMPPSYEECLKAPPGGFFYEVPLSPPPPYIEEYPAQQEQQINTPSSEA